MSLGPTAPATPALSAGRPQPSVDSLNYGEQQSLRLDLERFQAPRGGAKAGPWPLAPRPRFPSRELPSSSSGVYASKSSVPGRAHPCGLAPPVSAWPATSGQGPVAQTPSPRPGPPPRGLPATATGGQAASPAKAVRCPASALAAHRRFRPSAAAGGSIWRGGCRDGSAPPRPTCARPVGRRAGLARGRWVRREAVPRLGGPARRSQDVHAAVGPIQVHVPEGRVLRPDPGSGQRREDDLLGAVKDPIQQELQGDESVQNHYHRGPKHWHCGRGKGPPDVLGLGGAGGAAVSVGQGCT
ncbi:ADP-ribosylation factor-related protein 1 isoform X1 [Cervus elaphus]|uniref:ADP-ribosylation factor-related protein 1 isoform X1 n=1 Tax=Cervus canadensis TaxID=1574408 RepID=UPI001C9E3575|nr:ADP-ribosylation factor-related protein 1 isoform X1 [Cervus canadensis]XP_043740431.1 ADP-ribosylation factor-related protein 1 isoform X1 [Cervus elaphus]